ncbi:MAG: NADH:ubiquinone reductase (Na(+)-transporting) subunit C, partial [Bacteroidales bacterium]|nr:NADH:ubiquinone reductase (Na(+)-transporting) subunit C [Bacteroidales bacterium]
MFSNRYTFLYTGILVVAVAVVLALAATLLQPLQTRNQKVAKMQEILKASGETVDAKQAEDRYNALISAELRVDEQGVVRAEYQNQNGDWRQTEGEPSVKRAFDCNMKAELAKGEEGLYPVFVGADGLYIVPLEGKGLWGSIWGYLAVESDFNTIAGVTFGHKSETPGLGAEIATDGFQSHFKGKKLFEPTGEFVSITVQKGGEAKYAGDVSHAVDAVSGGTITSNGVTAMLRDCLRHYVAFFEKGRGEVMADTLMQDSIAEAVVPEPEPEPVAAPVVKPRPRKVISDSAAQPAASSATPAAPAPEPAAQA